MKVFHLAKADFEDRVLQHWPGLRQILNCLCRADNCETSHCVTVVRGMASIEIPIVSFIHIPYGQPSAVPVYKRDRKDVVYAGRIA